MKNVTLQQPKDPNKTGQLHHFVILPIHQYVF